jgi:hypothetical protein
VYKPQIPPLTASWPSKLRYISEPELHPKLASFVQTHKSTFQRLSKPQQAGESTSTCATEVAAANSSTRAAEEILEAISRFVNLASFFSVCCHRYLLMFASMRLTSMMFDQCMIL